MGVKDPLMVINLLPTGFSFALPPRYDHYLLHRTHSFQPTFFTYDFKSLCTLWQVHSFKTFKILT